MVAHVVLSSIVAHVLRKGVQRYIYIYINASFPNHHQLQLNEKTTPFASSTGGLVVYNLYV